MEHILVAIDECRHQPEALAHGRSLALRIKARLYVLFIDSGRTNATNSSVRHGLELFVSSAKSEGLNIEYFIAEGGYEDAVVSFVRSHGITLLIYETTQIAQSSSAHCFPILRTLKHRISCRVELITPQTRVDETKRG